MKERWVCGREKEEQGRQEGSRMMKGPVRGRKKKLGSRKEWEKRSREKRKKRRKWYLFTSVTRFCVWNKMFINPSYLGNREVRSSVEGQGGLESMWDSSTLYSDFRASMKPASNLNSKEKCLGIKEAEYLINMHKFIDSVPSTGKYYSPLIMFVESRPMQWILYGQLYWHKFASSCVLISHLQWIENKYITINLDALNITFCYM